ncbi:MAG: hypothetical protein NWE77_06495 [Candidatus Bathyarchaeota archaeon]|jgi:hypothetical protein|nr:hypothetical protein [Candidatus Bathyarchaeota archaeon]
MTSNLETRTPSKQEDNKLASSLLHLFVNRRDNYAVQRRNGSYFRVEELLTLEVLRQHLEGKITVGAYQLNAQSMVKTLIFDLDPEKLEDPQSTAKTIVEECVNKPSPKKPRFCRKAVVVEASRFGDPSYHIWVFFQPVPVPAQVARWLGFKILEHANLSPRLVEVFPKQDKLTEARPYGNFVKLPLGKHQAHDKWSRFLDLETFEPLPSICLFNTQGVSFPEQDIRKILGFSEKTHVQAKLDLPKNYKPLKNREEEKVTQFLVKYWIPGNRNQVEMAFLGLCLKRSVAHQSAKRIIQKVAELTGDEETSSRLQLVDYHYKSRRSLGCQLLGLSGLRKIVRGLPEK